MDFSKRDLVPDFNPSDLRTRTGSRIDETDENAGSFHKGPTARSPDHKIQPTSKSFMSATISSASKKKILAERNLDTSSSDHSDAHFDSTPTHITPLAPRPRGSGDRKAITSGFPQQAPYDPVNNYLSPRPQFLRYNPDRRREFLRRMEGTMDNEEDESSSVSSASPPTTRQKETVWESEEDGSDVEDDGMEEDADEGRPRCSTMVCKLLLLFLALVCSTCYISSMNLDPVPSLQDYDSFLGNPFLMQEWVPRRAGNLSMFSGDILESLATNTAPVEHPIGSASKDEGIKSNLFGSDGFIKGEELEAKELHGETTDSHHGVSTDSHVKDSATGNEGNNTDLFLVVLEESQPDGIGSVLGDEDNLLVNGSLIVNDSATDENNKDDVIVQKEYGGTKSSTVADEWSGREEIERPEASTVQDGQLNFLVQGTGDAEITEPSRIPQSQIVLSTPSDVGSTEPSEFSNVSRDVLGGLWICLLTVIIGLLSFIYKYFLKCSGSPLYISPPCCEPAVQEKATRAVSLNEKIENKGSDLKPSNHPEHTVPPKMKLVEKFIGVETTISETTYAQNLERRGAEDLRSSMPLNHSIDEHEELYASQPPQVELLGEFSIVGITVSEAGSYQRMERNGAQESQVSHSERRRTARKNLSSSANKAYPSSSMESFSKTDNGNGQEIKGVTTPLRRSSRLRSQATP